MGSGTSQTTEREFKLPTRPIAGKRFVPTGFFVLRTPLYPESELSDWGAGLHPVDSSPETVAADRDLLRERLQKAVTRPEAAEAIFLASPDLEDRLAAWQKKPDSEKGQRIERALVRYYVRMVGRPTPFGLFAGCSVGRIADATSLVFAERNRYGRRTRLDMDYLFALAAEIEKDSELRSTLHFFPNTSLYEAAGRLRYAESRLDGIARNHHLVAVEKTDYLVHALEFSAAGVLPAEIAGELVRMDPEIELEEAAEFVEELIESQLLVSEIALPVTGPEAITDLISQLASRPGAAAIVERLRQAQQTLHEFDERPPGISPQQYRGFADGLKDLPAKIELKTLIQVDMVKPAPDATLGRNVVAELLRGIELLHKMVPRESRTGIDSFRDEFQGRYEDRQVPLVEVLDEEIGIGFMKSSAPTAEGSPLLAGLMLPGQPAEERTHWGQLQSYKLKLLTEALAEGRAEVEIDEKVIDDLAFAERMPLPDAFSAMGILAGPSLEAVQKGDFQFCMNGVAGPSGARLLGRFCHLDSDLQDWVEKHLRAEETHHPDAVFAEVVHLPQGRIGNILFRPIMRDHEIPFLGRSVLPQEQQIPVTDLFVGVRNGRVVLTSRKLGREIIPRLTTAHNYAGRSLGMYKFLCSLQSQGVIGGVSWSWDALDSAPFLPRVRWKKLVLGRARWMLYRKEIEKLSKVNGAKLLSAVQDIRRRRNLPRMMELVDGDNSLPVDLDNVLSIEVLVNLIKNRPAAALREIWPGSDQLVAHGPEGAFVHELVIPFDRVAEAPEDSGKAAGEPVATEAQSAGAVAAAQAEPLRRLFVPGSEWLYAKLYCGTSNADLILREVIAPVVAEVKRSGAADNWFFIRYGDPEWHLRLRFRGDPSRLNGEVLPLLNRTVEPLLADGRMWKMLLDTYDREVERYGGPQGIELAERMWQADSEAILTIVSLLTGDEGADARWRLTMRGIDALLDDIGLDLAGKLGAMERMQESFWREHHGNKSLKKQLSQRFRKEMKDLEKLLDSGGDESDVYAAGIKALQQRSRAWAEPIDELKARAQAGKLIMPIASIATSFVHMHANRLLRSAARAQEMVMYEFICRIYSSRLARARKADTRRHS